MKYCRLLPKDKFFAYLEFVRDGAVSFDKDKKGADYLAERLAKENGLDLNLLEEARNLGRRRRYEKLVDRMRDGQLQYEEIARKVAADYGFPENEIDAALDENNSRGFANLIKEFSQKTQFLIATHNRATMEVADLLYGVTMGDDGASKIYSLKLENDSPIV